MGTKGSYVTIDFIKEQANDILDFENVLNKYKIAELAWNVIVKLGDPSILITRVTDGKNGPSPIDIINYRGLLPLDMVEIINGTIRNYDTKVKMIPTSNPFFLSDKEGTLTVDETLDDGFVFPARVKSSSTGVIDKYMIQNGEIITTLEEGNVELSYKAFPLDDNGFPKIPDEEKLIELIKWSILERAALKLWYKGKLSERQYNHIESKYLYYKKAASNQLKINSIPEMEAFKNRFLRLNQDPNLYSNDFIDFGYPEDFIKHSM